MGRDEVAQDQQKIERDQFERELDAVLTKYAAAEPREGLESRILANLQAERIQAPNRAWWRWSLAALTAIVILVATLVWRIGPSQHEVMNHIPATVEAPKAPTVQVASTSSSAPARANHAAIRNTQPHHSLPTVAAALPKLDQFPSPQPLSEQEKLLAGYIYRYPKDAALIAEARMESLRLDQEEMQQATFDGNQNLQ